MIKKEMIAMLLAGGQGSRLGVLTSKVAKPAVAFGGKYRIIDFPLSNCINSGVDTVGVLTQYQPLRLNTHIGIGIPWDLDRNYGGVTVLPPYERSGSSEWYSGTANAIYQNLDYMEQFDPDYVLILSGDHIYKMDYAKMLDFHKSKNADLTIAVINVSLEEASRFGIMNCDENYKVVEFEEKPKKPKSTLASMGIYIFNYKVLRDALNKDAKVEESSHDFGKNIIPNLLEKKKKVYAYRFDGYWKDLGITKEQFLELGMKPRDESKNSFNMGILALKIAGKKNGVSRLHESVSRELFSDVWPDIAPQESPITYVTNGVHTCSWLAPNLKELYNQYLEPYWQDRIYSDETWKRIDKIPDEELWEAHKQRKIKLLKLVRDNVTARLKNNGVHYEKIREIVSGLNPDALTIGFARRFATYKRAALIFKDLERITQILNDTNRPVQIIFAGKAHPADKEGQDLIKYIHEISLMPQFKGKIFLLENYNINVARHLVSGVDVWLNNPRRPMEASGTSGEKASVNGVVNFSILDGWWAEGYNTKNGWAIGTNEEYYSYEEQDLADSESIYKTLEDKIIPTYYNKNEKGISETWIRLMKNSIMSTGGKYSTARMLVDYTEKLYMPLLNLTNKYFSSLENVTEYNRIKQELYANWNDIKITQENNADNITVDAGNKIKVSCKVELPNIDKDYIQTECYYGKILENGIVEDINIMPMDLVEENNETKTYTYEAKIEMKTGGNYGYTFRVMPKHPMLLDPENLNLVKWITK